MKIGRPFVAALALAALPALTGCVSLAEFRKLQYEVRQMRAGGGGAPRLADVSSEIHALEERISTLEGRVEVSEHQAQEALEEAKKARLAATQSGAAAATASAAAIPA